VTTHIAGLDIKVHQNGRDLLRQRCAWCPTILIDHDLSLLAYPVDQEGPRSPAIWTVGALVKVDGHMSYIVDEEKLPDDACASIDPEVTRSSALDRLLSLFDGRR